MSNGKAYVPNAAGFHVKLPDGVDTQVRFYRNPAAPSGFTREWLVANRAFPTPETHLLEKCVPRVTEYFKQPHTAIDPDDDALALHQSYQAAFNVQGHLLREAGDIQGGARLGAAPWHLGMLATSLCIFDLFRGRHVATVEYAATTISVTAEHVERVASLF